jgi:hypothetical protein
MIQEILTYLIVIWAFTVAGRSFWRTMSALRSGSGISCSGGCSGCAAKNDLMKDIRLAGKVKPGKLNLS